MLLALVTASKHLRIVRASINWGLPPADKQVPQGAVPLRPSLREMHVDTASFSQHEPNETTVEGQSGSQITHIEVLSSAPTGPGHGQPIAPPVVLIVRSCVNQDGSYDPDCQTILDRWQIINEQSQSLSAAFQQLGSKPQTLPVRNTSLFKVLSTLKANTYSAPVNATPPPSRSDHFAQDRGRRHHCSVWQNCLSCLQRWYCAVPRSLHLQ